MEPPITSKKPLQFILYVAGVFMGIVIVGINFPALDAAVPHNSVYLTVEH